MNKKQTYWRAQTPTSVTLTPHRVHAMQIIDGELKALQDDFRNDGQESNADDIKRIRAEFIDTEGDVSTIANCETYSVRKEK